MMLITLIADVVRVQYWLQNMQPDAWNARGMIGTWTRAEKRRAQGRATADTWAQR